MGALARSALWHSVLLVGSGAYLSWPLFGWSSFLSAADLGKEDSPVVALFLLVLVALAGIAFALRWLVRLPGVFLEVKHLLDSTDPTLMRLTVHKSVTTDSEGDSTTTWSAALTGGAPFTHLSFELGGILPPAWLRSTEFQETPVLVYGLPPPGPYLIELEDGRLAVVHPD